MLISYGWGEALQHDFAPFAQRGLQPARVIAQHRGLWRLATDNGETEGRLGGRFAHEARDGGYPVTGDWAAIQPHADFAVIEAVLPRRTAFNRQAAGTGQTAQVVAANVDVVLI